MICTARAALFILLLLFAVAADRAFAADDPRARTIMQRVHDRNDGDNMTCDMEMSLVDRQGRERLRRLRQFSKDRGKDSVGAIFFSYPADVAGTGFLTYDYDQPRRDDDQWLYLPALKKTKRIASSDKSGSFMGSDFSYYDLTKYEPADYDFTLQKDAEVDGQKVWVVQAIPRSREVIDESGYEKALLLVRQDNYVAVRSVSWLKGGDLKYMDMKKLQLIDGIWIGTEVSMTTKRGQETRHKTVLRLTNVKFNQRLEEEMFSVRRLERGI